MIIRLSTLSDLHSLEILYPAAFPEEDLLPLVRNLETGKADTLSLVAEDQGTVIGHLAFTICHVEGVPAGLLAPLCVDPAHHKQGIGSALVREGFKHLEARGVLLILVLGDPAYYGRFGFAPERQVLPPYPLPSEWADAWQSVQLAGGGPRVKGQLAVPRLWQNPALWG